MLCSAVIKSARAPLWCEEQNSLVGHSVRAQTASVGLGCVEKHGTRRAHARRAHAHEKGQALSCRGGSVASVPSWRNRKAPAPRQANGDWNVHESMHARTCATHGAVQSINDGLQSIPTVTMYHSVLSHLQACARVAQSDSAFACSWVKRTISGSSIASRIGRKSNLRPCFTCARPHCSPGYACQLRFARGCAHTAPL